jgi:protein-disulfide isomerase
MVLRAISLLICLLCSTVSLAEKNTDYQIDKAIHQYLMDHPETIIESLKNYQNQQMAQMKSQTQLAIKEHKQSIYNNNQVTVIGHPKAPITLFEFMDYQCGHCKSMHTLLTDFIKQHPKVRLVVVELPIFGGNSTLAAKAAIAAGNQGQFAAFHKQLVEVKPGSLNQDSIDQIAKSLGLNEKKFKADSESKQTQAMIDKNLELAKTLRIMGTPFFIFSEKTSKLNPVIEGATSQQDLEKQLSQLEHAP